MSRLYIAFGLIIALSSLLLFLSSNSLIINNDSWLDEKDPLHLKEKFTENTFKLHPSLSIGVTLNNPLEKEVNLLNKVKKLKKKLTENAILKKYIKEVKTPFDLTQIFTNKQKQLVIKNSFELIKTKELSLKKILSLNQKNPYSSVFLSKDNTSFFFKILTYKDLTFKEEQKFFKEIFAIIKETPLLKNHYLTGGIYVNYISNQTTLEDLKRISIITIFLVFIFLLIYTRSLTTVLVITTPAFLCFSVSLYLLLILSEKITIVSIIIPCTAFVIALSDSVHIFYRSVKINRKNQTHYNLFKIYIKQIFFPCFITSFTTAIGFASFCLSNLTQLSNFSYIAMPIIMINFVIVVIVTSLLITIHEKKIKLSTSNLILFSCKIFKYKNVVLLITGLLFLNILVLQQLEIEGNFVSMLFGKNSKVRKDIKWFDNNFKGTMDLNIIIRGHGKDYFKSIKNYQKITQLQKKINSYPEIEKILSYQDQIQLIHKEFNQSTNHPQSNSELEQELFFLNLSKSDKQLSSLRPYITFKFEDTRIHFITKLLSIKVNNRLVEKIEEDLQKIFPNNETFITGNIKVNNTISSYVLKTQFRSVMISVVTIFLIFMFYFGFKTALIAMVPNVLPIISVLSIITYLKIPLDISVVLLVTITFSFCVDNTSHFIHFYNHSSRRDEANLIKTLNALIRPFLLTTSILIIGLISFALSYLLFLQRFGIFASCTIIMAFIANVLILPILIKQFMIKQ